jgi:hyaluronan synthase
MLTFYFQTLDFWQSGIVFLFALIMAFVTVTWIAKWFVAFFYRPYSVPFFVDAAVIVPVTDEDSEIFKGCIESILSNEPSKLVVVHNGPESAQLRELFSIASRGYSTASTYVQISETSKRKAISAGLALIQEEIVILVDSDVYWESDTLGSLLKPFSDRRVGGATTRQKIFASQKKVFQRWAAWFELLRANYQMPAMSVFGTVGCLPGRTIAFRAEILRRNMALFLGDRFLGTHLEISDDRALTNYVLKDGFKTVYQDSSRVSTAAPETFRAFVRQQYRWAKGSQYNTLRMIPWMAKRAKFLLWLYIADLILPVLLAANVLSWAASPFLRTNWASGGFAQALVVAAVNGVAGIGLLLLSALAASWAFFALRTSRVISESPVTFFLLPVFMFLNVAILVPVRVAGLLTCAWNTNWGTRMSSFDTRKARRRMAKKVNSWRQLIPTVTVPLVIVAIATLALRDWTLE